MVVVLSLLSGVAELMQTMVVGPRWIRWYFADFSFTAFVIMLQIIYQKIKFSFREVSVEEKNSSFELTVIISVILVPIMGAIFEWAQFKNVIIGHGDLVDIYVYFFGALVVLMALIFEKRMR